MRDNRIKGRRQAILDREACKRTPVGDSEAMNGGGEVGKEADAGTT